MTKPIVTLAYDNVTELPRGNLRDVADMAHRFADRVDAGELGEVNRAVCIVENENGLVLLGWGEGTTAYELMGLFEAAKLRVFADDLIDDD